MTINKLTDLRKPIEIALSPVINDIKREYQNEKIRKKRGGKRVRLDIRYTKRSIKIIRDIAVNVNLPVAYIMRELIDSLFCGDLKQRILTGTVKQIDIEEFIYD